MWQNEFVSFCHLKMAHASLYERKISATHFSLNTIQYFLSLFIYPGSFSLLPAQFLFNNGHACYLIGLLIKYFVGNYSFHI